MSELRFKGKEFVYNHHLAVPHRPLEIHKDKGIGKPTLDGNLVIQGDNLHALKTLVPMYAERVDCIFIDPPCNTGNEGWCYNDNVSSPMTREWLDANPIGIEDGLRHDKWCAMMWPRLMLLHELLAENGVIYVCIDDNELHRLRMILDEIFGEHNFLAMLTRRAMHTVRNSSKDFNLNADYILVYARDKNWFSQDRSRYIRHVVDKSGKYPHDDGDGRGRYKLDPIHARNYYHPYTHAFADGTRWSPPPGRYPVYSRETLEEMEEEDRIVFRGREPRAKRYLNEVQEGQPPDAVLSHELVGFNKDGTSELRDLFGRGGVFPQPKPTRLIRFLLEILRNRNALVLDSFAGSGTTAHAVLAQNQEDGGNRRFILVECENYAESVTANRVKLAIESASEGQGGIKAPQFTFCTLGEPLEIERLFKGRAMPTYETLGSALFHMATNQVCDPGAIQEKEYYLGRTEERHVWMIYKPDLDWLKSPQAALTLSFARNLSEFDRDRKHLVFAPALYAGRDLIRNEGLKVEFVTLPYALYRIDMS